MNSAVQDTINCLPRSWENAIDSIADVNELFPEYGKAFFGTVMMPRNMGDITGVVDFATTIGWNVSLVPFHGTTPMRPRGFRSFDDDMTCCFQPATFSRIREIINELKDMRNNGYNLYDSDEYLEDVYRFIVGNPVRWRRRNNEVCDSPYLYFAIEPNGNIAPCCDYKLRHPYPIYDERFPAQFRSGEIHEEIRKFTTNCPGCMYGSYPEITLTARFLKPLLYRLGIFLGEKENTLKRLSKTEIIEIAREIHFKQQNDKLENVKWR